MAVYCISSRTSFQSTYYLLCAETNTVGRLFMLSLAHPSKYYQLFLSQGVGMGLGAGFVFTPAMAIQAHYFRKKRPLAMGIVVSGASLRSLILCPLTLYSLYRLFGWGYRVPYHAQSTISWIRWLSMGRSLLGVPHTRPPHSRQYLHDPKTSQAHISNAIFRS